MPRLCKYCKSELPDGAKICPTCKKKQKGPMGVIIAIVVVFIIIGIAAGSGGNSTDEQNKAQDMEKTAENVENQASNETTVSESTEETDESEKVEMTAGQKNAYKAAKNYLEFMSFSKDGLINQLSSEYGDGYSVEDAEFAVNYLEENGEVDWNEQAYKAAKNYLNTMSFSLDNLINQLESDAGDKYTHEQAVYGAEKAYNE